jgi:hypothetical protein
MTTPDMIDALLHIAAVVGGWALLGLAVLSIELGWLG